MLLKQVPCYLPWHGDNMVRVRAMTGVGLCLRSKSSILMPQFKIGLKTKIRKKRQHLPIYSKRGSK